MVTYILNYLSNHSQVDIKSCILSRRKQTWNETSCEEIYCLWLVTQGIIKVTVDDKEFLLGENDAFLFFPEMLFKAQSITHESAFIITRFDFVVGENTRGLSSFALAGYIPEKDLRPASLAFKDAFEKQRRGVPFASFLLKGQFISLLSKIFSYRLLTEKDAMSVRNRKKLAMMIGTFKYIANNISKHISVSELARRAGMSEKYFITLFKQAFGITPAKYITKEKMKKAMEYLNEGIYSIKEISQKLGYSDQYTFSKAFSKMHSVPPSKFLSK